MSSEKIDSTHFNRREDFSIASGEVGMGPNRQKWQLTEEELQVETLGEEPTPVRQAGCKNNPKSEGPAIPGSGLEKNALLGLLSTECLSQMSRGPPN